MSEVLIQNVTDHQKSVISYYDNTWLDYRALWMNKKDRAIHFGYYDTFSETHTESLNKLNSIMCQKAGITSSSKVLDAGCGQGGSALWMAENINVQVTGITLVPHQVEIATREARKRGLADKVKFYQKDYTVTGFESNSFDIVWACESLCHALDKYSFYQEAFRILKPGGKIIIAEYIRASRETSPENEAILHHWCKGWSMPDLGTWEEHSNKMTVAGFQNISEENITANVKPSLNRLYKMSVRYLTLGKLLYFLKIRNSVKHGNHLASLSQYEALTKKLWYYCLYSAEKPISIK